MADTKTIAIGILIVLVVILGAVAGYFASQAGKTVTVPTTVYRTVTVTQTVGTGAPATVTKSVTVVQTKVITVTTALSPAPTALKKISLSVEFGEPWKDLVMPIIDKYKEYMKNLGYDVDVKLKMIPYGQDFVAIESQDFAAGTAGDVVIVDSFMIPSYAAAGYLYPLDDLVKTWSGWNAYPEPMKKIVSYKDHVYGIMIDTDVRMIWYRKDIFKMAGLPEDWQPKSWEDIAKAIKALLTHADEIKKNLDITEFYPFYIPAGTKWGEGTTMQGFYMVLLGADKPPYNRLYDYSTGKWICKSTALWRAFWFYTVVYNKLKAGPVAYNFAADVWATHRKVFSEGKVAMDVGGSWEWGEGWGPKGIAPLKACKAKCGEDEKCYTDCEWQYIGFAKMPGWSGGAHGEPAFVTISGGWAVVINAKSARDPDKLKAAWEFIKILASKENIAQYCAKFGKVAPRLDAVEVPVYAQNKYLKAITEYLEFTDFRDAMPMYPKVSLIIQKVTEMIVKGQITDATTALDTYCRMLKETVGADKVEELPVDTTPPFEVP